MNRKTPEDLIQSSDEYAKLNGRLAGSAVPRGERRRAPRGHGLGRSELETWTTEELRSAAATLGTPHTDVMRRDELIEALLAAELSSVRGRGTRFR